MGEKRGERSYGENPVWIPRDPLVEDRGRKNTGRDPGIKEEDGMSNSPKKGKKLGSCIASRRKEKLREEEKNIRGPASDVKKKKKKKKKNDVDPKVGSFGASILGGQAILSKGEKKSTEAKKAHSIFGKSQGTSLRT